MLKILFVCHGNICRSTMAQFLFRHLALQKGLSISERIDEYGDVFADSAATSREELGNPVDRRTVMKLKEHGIICGQHRARQITAADYYLYDLIILMDEENQWGIHRIIRDDPEHKIHMMMEYADGPEYIDRSGNPRDVADPWYTHDFEMTYQDLLAGCTGLLKYLFGV